MQITIKQIAADFPGLIKRYVPQEVEKSPEVPVCVMFDGICNHADSDYEEVALSHDPTETENALVCIGCGAVYNHHEEEWLR